jgi:lysophospholipase L1-like esterase
MFHNMNTTPNLKRVLIYGDSNTWGKTPIAGSRYPINERWTGIVQTMLGDKFDVIEQGLVGRAAGNIDKSNPYKNGHEHFLSSILPQYPFDILVIALGTNDLSTEFSRTPEQILADLAEYTEIIRENKINCKLIYITPFTFYLPIICDQAKEKVAELAKLFTVTDFDYLDMSKFEPKGTDRVHFTKEDHAMYAKLVYEKINSLK